MLEQAAKYQFRFSYVSTLYQLVDASTKSLRKNSSKYEAKFGVIDGNPLLWGVYKEGVAAPF